MVKSKYSRNEDVREAIIEALSNYFDHPAYFPHAVYEVLINKKFDVKYLSYKRIWRLYEDMVKKGKIVDILDVLTSSPP
jgi:hypothetical protein